MTRKQPSDRPAFGLKGPLAGKAGMILVGAVALIGLNPAAQDLFRRLQAPGIERDMGGPGFPRTFKEAETRIGLARGAPLAAAWGPPFEREDGTRCRGITVGAFWRVCGRGEQVTMLEADAPGHTPAEGQRDLALLIEAAARGSTPDQRAPAMALLKRPQGGAATVGRTRIVVLPGRLGGWYFFASPV